MLVALFFAFVGMQNVFYKIYVLRMSRFDWEWSGCAWEWRDAWWGRSLRRERGCCKWQHREPCRRWEWLGPWVWHNATEWRRVLRGTDFAWRVWSLEGTEDGSRRDAFRKVEKTKGELQSRGMDHLLDPAARSTILTEEWTEKRCMLYKNWWA